MHTTAGSWGRIQATLFSHLEQCLAEPLTDMQHQLAAILEVVRVEEAGDAPQWRGRPPCDRGALARASVAKAFYNLPTTRVLVELLRSQPNLRQLCGFPRPGPGPSLATFSRAFTDFATAGLADEVHQALVAQHLGDELFGHIAREGIAIEGREKPHRAPPSKPREPPFPLTRLERQREQSPEAALAELAQGCGIGCKRDSHGHPHYWIGSKAQLDVTDDMLPISMLTTSEQVHDRQVAIPLAQLSAKRHV